MSLVYIHQLGVSGPGLHGWDETKKILRGEQPYVAAEYEKPTTSILPKNEHRRTTSLIKLALSVAQDAVSHSDYAASALAAVFASADGDLEITHKICLALNMPDKPVSPTYFHNSVHNAAAGYWAIATHSSAPSTSICAYDNTFAAGLLEAVCQVRIGQQPVLLVVYDYNPPFPLSACRTYRDPFAVSFLLTADAHKQNLCEVQIDLLQGNQPAAEQDELPLPLENPDACALKLLQPLAMRKDATVTLDYNYCQQLTIRLRHANNS